MAPKHHLCGPQQSFDKTYNTMVLKRVPFGSLREEFFIPGGKFVSGRNWGGKGVDEKN